MDMQKKLFEKKDWRDNDIAKQVETNKQRDMDLLLSRYNHLKKIESEEELGVSARTPAAPVVNADAAMDPSPSRKNKVGQFLGCRVKYGTVEKQKVTKMKHFYILA